MITTRAIDELARALAQPMPRRRALRVVVGTVVGLALPVARVPSARAAGTITCLLPSQPVPCTCGGKFNLCCSTRDRCDCFPDRAVCTVIPCKPGETDYGSACCKSNERYDSDIGACVCAQRCGSDCCTSKQTCINGACCPNTRVCGSTCCASGKTCTFKRGAAGGRGCCPANRVVRRKLSGQSVKFCCPPGTVRVAGDDCCPPGDPGCCDQLAPLVPTKTRNPYVGAIFCVRGKPQPLL